MFRSLNKILTTGLVVALLMPVFTIAVSAQQTRIDPEFTRGFDVGNGAMPASGKFAPDLEEMLRKMENGEIPDAIVGVIITFSPEIAAVIHPDSNQPFEIVLANLDNLVRAHGGTYLKVFRNLGLAASALPLSRLRLFALQDAVAYLSPDRKTGAMGHLSQTTGADLAWSNVRNTTPYANGKGIGIAILDSGVDPNHKLWYGQTGKRRVVFSKDFTGRGTALDEYGHGSHVASMAAANAMASAGDSYRAPAFEANLINLRVLDDRGEGVISGAIEAIDWILTNRRERTASHNIRVINMSFGTPPKDTYRNDPLCKTARTAYDNGILVVASAGNIGRDSSGNKLYGGINSPGIEPSVLTVGAANTFGTLERSDDVVTTYSSRGPTRGFTVDSGGNRIYDNLIKPELVAPGNRLIGVRSASSRSNPNAIVNKYPSLDVNPNASDDEGVMYMSGTSMAAPVVAGAAAMIFQARPDFPPGLVKTILMYTAQPIQGANTLEQGAGLLNIKGATEVVNLVNPHFRVIRNFRRMLRGELTNQQQTGQCSWIGNFCYSWGRGVVTNYGFLYGDRLLTTKQPLYVRDIPTNGTILSGNYLVRTPRLTSGVSVYQGAITNNGVIIADGEMFLPGSMMGNNTLSHGVIVGDGVLVGDGVIIGDGVIVGDNTPGMSP